MSTKIYSAFRCKLPQLEAFIDELHQYQFGQAAKLLKKLHNKCKNDEHITKRLQWYFEQQEQCETIEEYDVKSRSMVAARIALAFALRASKSKQREFGCLDCSFNIWIRGKYVYIIPYGDFKEFESKMAEEYAYWNNSDRPESISDKEWDKRGKEWNPICDDWDNGRMVHEVINVKDNIGVYDLAEKLVGKKRKFADAACIDRELMALEEAKKEEENARQTAII